MDRNLILGLMEKGGVELGEIRDHLVPILQVVPRLSEDMGADAIGELDGKRLSALMLAAILVTLDHIDEADIKKDPEDEMERMEKVVHEFMRIPNVTIRAVVEHYRSEEAKDRVRAIVREVLAENTSQR